MMRSGSPSRHLERHSREARARVDVPARLERRAAGRVHGLMTCRWFALVTLTVFTAGCGARPASSGIPGTIELRYMNPGEGCMLAALPRQVTIRIDPTAAEQVVAIAPDGTRYHVWWSVGFVGGSTEDRVVLDPDGAIVAQDGQVLTDQSAALGGYTVCAGSGSLWVYLEGPAGAAATGRA